MITITTEYLDANWSIIVDRKSLPVQFSDWDGGDAYTLADLGVIHSTKAAFIPIALGDVAVSGFPIVVRLHEESGETTEPTYQSPDGTTYRVSAERTEGDRTESIPVIVQSVAEHLSSRRRGLLESDMMKDRSVLVVGVGTGGITVALELAKSGVGRFVLMDPDRLEIGNVSRHSAGISFVGRRKVAAAKDMILDTNPSAAVETHAVRADQESEGLLRGVVENVDLVICATDSRPSKLFINRICVATQKPAIYGGAFRRAYGGQVLRVRPGSSACYHCFVLTMPEKESDREVTSQENANAIAYSDMPVAIEPGLSMDVLPISTMLSKLALHELLAGKESTLHMLDKDFEANWYFWVNRPEPNTDYASWPPLSESMDDMTILRWYGVYMDKDEGCPTCGDFGKAIAEQYGLEAGTTPSIPLLASEPEIEGGPVHGA